MFKLKVLSVFIVLFNPIFTAEQVLGEHSIRYKLMQSRESFMSRTEGGRQDVDEALCELQNDLTGNSLIFTDASGKIPAGILAGNMNHFGHYEQCLSIDEMVDNVNIRGKYCMMRTSIALDDNFVIPGGLPRALPPGFAISGMIAVCVPNACPASIDIGLPGVDVTSEELFCREVNDKPVSTQDIVAIVLFSIIGLLILAGTSYHLYNKILYNKDVPKIAKTFSAYHHMDKLTTYPTNVNPLSCINGIRTISTFWVILGHNYTSAVFGTISNPLSLFEFSDTFGATFVLAGNLAVDTFFYLAAFLLTWSLLKKFNNGVAYAKSVPFIALNRYLRLTPLLAAVMLLKISFFHHVSDGPAWSTLTFLKDRCLDSWWVNLIYLQNYMRPSTMCMPESWYLAFDMQLNLAAPIVIVFLFSGMKYAIFALTSFCIVALGAVLGYQYAYNVDTPLQLMEQSTTGTFGELFFNNTTSCTAQFLLGIVVAYVLFQMKNRNISITNKLYMVAHWVITAALLILPFYGIYSTNQSGVSRHTLNFFNAWHSPAWVLGVAGVIVACMHGFGGPVQWFLGHKMWTIPARLSYALYLIHYQIIFVVVGSLSAPFAFSNARMLDRFVSDLGLTFIASFILHVCVEAPFADLCNMFMAKITGGQRKDNERKLDDKKEIESSSPREIDTEKQVQ